MQFSLDRFSGKPMIRDILGTIAFVLILLAAWILF
jgi:hypothetical protein